MAKDGSVIGCVGRLIVPTRGSAGPGEVLIRYRGGLEALIAWSDEPIPRGASVLVINERGRRAVDVSMWPDPLDPLPGDGI